MLFNVVCIKYSTNETKEADRIEHKGFPFQHKHSGEDRGHYLDNTICLN